MRGFSFSSVILSYFLVGGGLFTGMLALWLLHANNQGMVYLALAAGAFVGGFVAARASRGETIVEPVIGAAAVVATVVALAGTTEIGKEVWVRAESSVIHIVLDFGLTGMFGALLGAWISEKMFGEATLSSVPWVLYTALSVFSASMLAEVFVVMLFFDHGRDTTGDKLAEMVFFGIGGGCLLAGAAVGASARTRPLLASLVGGAAGVAGFLCLVSRNQTVDRNTIIGFVVLAIGGGIVSLIGTLIGWATVGKTNG